MTNDWSRLDDGALQLVIRLPSGGEYTLTYNEADIDPPPTKDAVAYRYWQMVLEDLSSLN